MDSQNDQGLPQDGIPPEPSQQNLEGNDPAPSQEEPGQITDQELEGMLPDQDSRGVPKENVLSEVLRKVNKLTEDLDGLRSAQSQPQNYQQPYQQPNIQQQMPQPQPQPKAEIPRTPQEAAQIIDREVRDKFGSRMGEPNFDPLEMLNYQNQRTLELNSMMTRNLNSIQMERNSSESRVKSLYPDLNNLQSQLAQGVLAELNRRAYLGGLRPEELYNKDPYVLESIAPVIASQLGIGAKAQGQPKIAPKQPNLPPSGFGGRQTVPKEDIKVTEADVAFERGFGVKAKTLAEIRKNSPDPREFVSDVKNLLS